jgi:hypothetical protein
VNGDLAHPHHHDREQVTADDEERRQRDQPDLARASA